jgi:hypothetical protein
MTTFLLAVSGSSEKIIGRVLLDGSTRLDEENGIAVSAFAGGACTGAAIEAHIATIENYQKNSRMS